MNQNKETIDIEKYAKKGQNPPKENVIYRFRVGDVHAEHDKAELTGREILVKVGLDPAQNKLYQKKKGKRFPIALTDIVDLSEPGVERFDTIPRDSTEG